jgi:hypothetical protein
MYFRSPINFLNDGERMAYGRELMKAKARQSFPYVVAPGVNVRRFDGSMIGPGEPVWPSDFLGHLPKPEEELRRLVENGSGLKR